MPIPSLLRRSRGRPWPTLDPCQRSARRHRCPHSHSCASSTIASSSLTIARPRPPTPAPFPPRPTRPRPIDEPTAPATTSTEEPTTAASTRPRETTSPLPVIVTRVRSSAPVLVATSQPPLLPSSALVASLTTSAPSSSITASIVAVDPSPPSSVSTGRAAGIVGGIIAALFIVALAWCCLPRWIGARRRRSTYEPSSPPVTHLVLSLPPPPPSPGRRLSVASWLREPEPYHAASPVKRITLSQRTSSSIVIQLTAAAQSAYEAAKRARLSSLEPSQQCTWNGR